MLCIDITRGEMASQDMCSSLSDFLLWFYSLNIGVQCRVDILLSEMVTFYAQSSAPLSERQEANTATAVYLQGTVTLIVTIMKRNGGCSWRMWCVS